MKRSTWFRILLPNFVKSVLSLILAELKPAESLDTQVDIGLETVYNNKKDEKICN